MLARDCQVSRELMTTRPSPCGDQARNLGLALCDAGACFAVILITSLPLSPMAVAQTFNVTYSFTGHRDGAARSLTLTMDTAGKL